MSKSFVLTFRTGKVQRQQFIKEYEKSADNLVDKEALLASKEWLLNNYAVSSANSMLAALNQYLIFREMGRLRLKRIKVQKSRMLEIDKELEKEDFQKLVQTAKSRGYDQIAMIMETVCATGIRIIVIPKALKKKLLIYRKKQDQNRADFPYQGGKEKDRSNIWREMKKIAGIAGVSLEKVFPHNLRHLFARTFYRQTKNLIHLSDLLGHSSLEVTKIYASDGIKEWRKSIEKIKLIETTT